MTVDTQAQIFNQIAMDAAPQQSLLAPPVPNGNNPSAIPNWFIAMESFLNNEVQQVATNNSQSSAPLVPQKITDMNTLMSETNTWMNQNFYPVSDWATLQSPASSRSDLKSAVH